eukprot:gnl/TRDRNA2_/TRDRNA2_45224_c0_seq2.p1 gnl/TRDRNA2_/TRDRNA2_45224_c0~~gnl/TRDRNA2_/TRDRNA2_45224_c0_seq2.p1  ORF type:complete len:206 (-),score=20.14 gnl/TRDRNA2_/TRDRNA2_45224_c0_seq2:126-689(-)
MAEQQTLGAHSIVYTVLFIWIVTKVTFWLGSLSEPECPGSIIVLMALSSVVLLALVLVHCLIFASYQVKYMREKRQLRDNSRVVQHCLRRLLRVEYVVMLILCLIAVPFLIREGAPRSLPDDENLSCQVSFWILWLDAATALILAIVYSFVRWHRIELVEALFTAKYRPKSVTQEYMEGGGDGPGSQ